MVALMKFTRDICRLLGLGSGTTARQEDHMDSGPGAFNTSNESTLSEDMLNGEEDLSEEEKARRRAVRRKAKRKRRRKRKQEQMKQSDSMEQEDDDEEEGGGVESDMDVSESEAEGDEEVMQKEKKKEVKPALSQCTAVKVPSGADEQHKAKSRSSEEEPEWDVSSAFFANAASHIKPKGSNRKSKENKENEARRETNESDSMTKKSTSLTEKGIKLVQEGLYSQAVSMFTEAIKCDPKDYRFFGNRSYCYYCLEQYPKALTDAERSILLAPDWPKGYFRKGSALMGMQQYSEAEKAMEQVLKLDPDCEEAVNDLYNCKVLQLMELGFEEMKSVFLLEKFSTVQAALTACCGSSNAAGGQDPSAVQPGTPCPSLWVGNVTTELSEKHLWDLFKMHGEIESIRVLHERFCAFVNFKNASMAASAMEKLNGYCIENTRLVVRYPDRRTQKVLPSPLKTCLPVTQHPGTAAAAAAAAAAAGARRRGPVNGDECYFWRTTGCHFGDKCRYKHIPDQKGKDRKPWQP